MIHANHESQMGDKRSLRKSRECHEKAVSREKRCWTHWFTIYEWMEEKPGVMSLWIIHKHTRNWILWFTIHISWLDRGQSWTTNDRPNLDKCSLLDQHLQPSPPCFAGAYSQAWYAQTRWCLEIQWLEMQDTWLSLAFHVWTHQSVSIVINVIRD